MKSQKCKKQALLERRILRVPKSFQAEGFNVWLCDPQEEIWLSHRCSYLQWRPSETLTCCKAQRQLVAMHHQNPVFWCCSLQLVQMADSRSLYLSKAICFGDFSQTVTFAPICIRWNLFSCHYFFLIQSFLSFFIY